MAAELSYRLKSKEESRSKEENIETNSSYPLPVGGAMGGFESGGGHVPGHS